LGFQVSKVSLVLLHPPLYGLCISSQFFHENPQVKVALRLVLARAMTRKPEPIEWDETATTATAVPEETSVEEEAATLTAH